MFVLMNLKKRLPLIMAIVAAVSVIGAILLFVLAVPNADATYKIVLEIIIAILLILMAGLIGYYLYLTRDSDPNFFLFDRTKKKNISVEELSFKTVNERMNVYLTMVGDSAQEIWQGGVLENDRKLGFRRVYRPLLAYKMLYDLADKNVDDYWDLLLECSPETLDSLCSALEQAGEAEMVKAFRFIMFNYRQTPEKVKDFIIGNLRYIRGRMMAYIKKNIELFY
jgi:hypothetical protein